MASAMSMSFYYMTPNLARCGLIIIPPRLNILSTGPTKRDQDRDSRFACKTETKT